MKFRLDEPAISLVCRVGQMALTGVTWRAADVKEEHFEWVRSLALAVLEKAAEYTNRLEKVSISLCGGHFS